MPARRTALTLLALAAWLGATLAFRPLALPDEGRYADVAWEMLRSGHWLEPTLDGLPFFHKPPLWYWLGAAAMELFGVHPWVVRLPSLAGAVLAGASLFLFLRRWTGADAAQRALAVFATLPLVVAGAQYANHDMLVAGFITACTVLAAHALLAREAGLPWRVPLALAYACAGCGVMTKGLIGAVLPGLVFAAWCVARRRTRALRLLAWPPGWALLLAIAVPWLAAIERRHPGFLHYFLGVQQVSRFTGRGFNNPHGAWFYPVALAVLGLPWTAWLWPVAQRGFFTGEATTRRDVRRLMAIWLTVVLVFFSLPRSKLVGYILPAAMPLAVLAAEGFASAWRARDGAWAKLQPPLGVVAGVSAVLCAGVVAGVALFGTSSGRPSVAAWAPAIGPADRVLMIDDYDYDLPFYLHLAQPVAVATQWSTAQDSDDWRRELRDAAAFAPAADRERLIEQSDVMAWLCRPGTTWVFGETPMLQALGARLIKEIAHRESVAVWRIEDEAGRASCLSPARPAQPPT